MSSNNWIVTTNNNTPISIKSIPLLDKDIFDVEVIELLNDNKNSFILSYCALNYNKNIIAIMIIGIAEAGDIYISSHALNKSTTIKSLYYNVPSITIFERDIHERYGISFDNNPWLKPVRYPVDRFDAKNNISDYPFFTSANDNLYPIHISSISTDMIGYGSFRLLCEDEVIKHVEIAMGYNHRGIENLIVDNNNTLYRLSLAEQISADSTIAHSLAMSLILEQGWRNSLVSSERKVALELERMLMHIDNTLIICRSIEYKRASAKCEVAISMLHNIMQQWCGNSYGRSLIRPLGSNYKIELTSIKSIKDNLSQIIKLYKSTTNNLLNNSSAFIQLDNNGVLSEELARKYGAIGVVAKASGMAVDSRGSFSFEPYKDFKHITQVECNTLSRLKQRIDEVSQSFNIINDELKNISALWFEKMPLPNYNNTLEPNSLTLALVEGSQGVITHIATTNTKGDIENYRIYDPSFKNWTLLPLTLGGATISDFSLANSSFNLSFAGHDL